jgi:DNA polymerase III epsilon subunit-like protein
MAQFTDLMIDLETLSTKDNAVITQIGLVAFNLEGPVSNRIGTHIFIDPEDAMRYGCRIDWPTVKWWLQQSDAARAQMVSRPGIPFQAGLARTIDFIYEHTVGAQKVRPWGNGAGFDVTLMEQAFRSIGTTVPWDFRNVRDLRTLADVAARPFVSRPRPETEHDALADAQAQAEWARRLFAAINPMPTAAVTPTAGSGGYARDCI